MVGHLVSAAPSPPSSLPEHWTAIALFCAVTSIVKAFALKGLNDCKGINDEENMSAIQDLSHYRLLKMLNM